MKVMSAIFTKQLNDVLKNPTITMIFFLMPLLGIVMGMFVPEDYADYVSRFVAIAPMAAMGIAMMPLTTMAAYIAEDIETRSLRFLVMAGVKPAQYLLGLASFTMVLSIISMLAMGLLGGLETGDILLFSLASVAGLLVSTVFGALLGILSKNVQQGMTFGSVAGIVIGMVPMFALMNDTIQRFTHFLFSQQATNIMMYIAMGPPYYVDWSLTEAFLIIGANLVVFTILFFVVYKVKGMNLD